MNERIRELAEQAKVDVGTLFAEMLCNDSEVNVKIAEAWNAQPQEVRTRIFQTIEQNQKKFAELIVRECANHCDLLLDHKISSEWSRGTHDCSRAIKKHFGVE